MAYGTLQTDVINSSTGIFSTNNAYSGIAKAWVQWVGSTATINSSFNVSSVTRNAAGDFTINFTTAMANANYAIAGICSYAGGINEQTNSPTRTTSAIRVYTPQTTNGLPTDYANNSLIVLSS